jgi:TonB family protein
MKESRAAFASRTLLALVCLMPSSARAEPAPPPGTAYRPSLVLQWKDRLQAANEHLLAAEWKKGYSKADAVLREMRNGIASGEGSGPMLAVALFHRAIGEAGLGRVEDASWDFCAAQALYAPYGTADLAPYGEAVAGLDAWRYVDGKPPTSATPVPPGAQPAPPRRIGGDNPHYPFAKSQACIERPVIVSSMINERGRVECPFVPANSDPVLAVAALEALRTWRFEPATLAGTPIRVSFSLSVDFQVRQCN